MNSDVRLERLIADVLRGAAPTAAPRNLASNVLAATSHGRRRPAWLARMTEHPMHLRAQVVVGSPVWRLAYLATLALLLALLTVGTVVIGASFVPRPVSPIPPELGTFSPSGSLQVARGHHTATIVADGRVLIIGGWDGSDVLRSSERWDPAAGSLSAGPSLLAAHEQHTATLLADGRILVIGGPALAELWDPQTDSFSTTGAATWSRTGHSATRLLDGRVLVVGGSINGNVIAETEIFDPATGFFSPTASLATPRYLHTATLLPDGRVLIVGGSDLESYDGVQVATAEVWDPVRGLFSPAGTLAAPRDFHTANLLPDGRVLVVGGSGGPEGVLASAELWDPDTMSFEPTGAMAEARSSHTATLLDDGRVLVVGGDVPAQNKFTCPEVCVASAEIWDPAYGTFAATGSLAEARANHTATPLSDGRVLVVGGGEYDASIRSAELFELEGSTP